MLIKIEIFLWLLLTLVLLLTPFVYFFKNYHSLTQGRRTRYMHWKEKSQKAREAKQVRKVEESKMLAREEISTNDIDASQDHDIHEGSDTPPEVAHSYESVVIKEEEPIPPKIQKKLDQHQPTPTQSQRIKDQKKIDEVRMSILSFKERGKVDEYEKKLIEGLALDPTNNEFNERLSDYYFENKQHIKALSLLKKIVNAAPENHKAIRQIGQIYMHQDDLDTAKILIEKAISVRDDNPKYYITLVDIHYAKNNIPDAIKALEKVLKLRPKNVKYLLSIATLHEEAAEPSKAVQYYGKVIELDPMNDTAKKGIQRLS